MAPSVKLSGADHFLLALDRHVKRHAGPSFVCRFAMLFEGRLEKSQLQASIAASPYFQAIEKLQLRRPLLGLAKWKLERNTISVPILESTQEGDSIPDAVLQSSMLMSQRPYCRFDLIHCEGSKTLLIFSWHHLLMDGFGANKLLASLGNQGGEARPENLFPKETKESLWKQWKQLVYTKDHLRLLAAKPLQDIKPEYNSQQVGFICKSLKGDRYQSYKQLSARHSRGPVQTPYLLAAVARSFAELLKQKNYPAHDLFVPIPMETRKAGAKGPLISNQYSMLFFRIRWKSLGNKVELIKDLNSQFFEQVRLRIPQQYASMIRMLRLIPTPLYYRLIRRPNGNSMAAFTFSQSPSPDNLKNLFGLSLLDVEVLPPSTTPPGISFQIMSFEERLKLVILYHKSCFTEEEANGILDRCLEELAEANE